MSFKCYAVVSNCFKKSLCTCVSECVYVGLGVGCVGVCVHAYVCMCGCMCVYMCVCVTMKKSARQMASTTSDTGDTSCKQQQAQRKENYNKSKRPVSSVDHCHPYRRKKRREAVY